MATLLVHTIVRQYFAFIFLGMWKNITAFTLLIPISQQEKHWITEVGVSQNAVRLKTWSACLTPLNFAKGFLHNADYVNLSDQSF